VSRSAHRRGRPIPWPDLKTLAVSLRLPHVTRSARWGQPCLKAHRKLWTWWSPHQDAPVFKADLEEGALRLETGAACFFITPHYRAHALILMRPAAFNPDWVRHNLVTTWKRLAPKRVLKAWLAEQGNDLAVLGGQGGALQPVKE
jgi:hypothetical protein